MGWKTINGRPYYYRSRREGGRVKTDYVGPISRTAGISVLDAEDRKRRMAEREAERAERREFDREQREMDEWFGRVEAVAHAALIAAGYHRHKRGEWRRRRDGRDERSNSGGGGGGPEDQGRD